MKGNRAIWNYWLLVWIVYILECADKTLYTGITNNLDSRITQHNLGQGAKYTRGRGPVKILYTENAKNRSEALKREIAIKAMSRGDKLKLVAPNQAD